MTVPRTGLRVMRVARNKENQDIFSRTQFCRHCLNCSIICHVICKAVFSLISVEGYEYSFIHGPFCSYTFYSSFLCIFFKNPFTKQNYIFLKDASISKDIHQMYQMRQKWRWRKSKARGALYRKMILYHELSMINLTMYLRYKTKEQID